MDRERRLLRARLGQGAGRDREAKKWMVPVSVAREWIVLHPLTALAPRPRQGGLPCHGALIRQLADSQSSG
jgi:hypothetical protein